MAEESKPTIHRMGILLQDSSPAIWRRVEVPSVMTLPQLHMTLQIVMGWENCHLHEFRIAGKVYGEPDPEDHHFGREVLNERRVPLARLVAAGSWFEYRYDFGDGWQHDILVEAVRVAHPRKRYPVCLEGARSAPPEDVGGMRGYQRYLEALFDLGHRDHQAMLAWRGRFDPEHFPITSVNRSLREAFPVLPREGTTSAARDRQ